MIDLVEKWDKGVLQQSSSSKVTYYVQLTFQSSFQKNSGTVEIRKVLFISPLPTLACHAFQRMCAKELGFGNQPFVMPTPPAGGLFRPMRPARFFFVSCQTRRRLKKKIGISSSKKLKPGILVGGGRMLLCGHL